jgi:hypothetical protein
MRAALAAIAVLAALAGCGDSGPSKADYIAKADRVCHAFDGRLSAISKRYNAAARSRNAAKAAAALDDEVGIGVDQLRDLRAIEPPGGQKDEVKAQLDLVRRQLTLIRGLEEALQSRNGQSMQRLATQIRSTAAKYRRHVKAFGYKVCGRGD